VTGTEAGGEIGKKENEREIGTVVRIEKIEIEGTRTEIVTEVAGTGKGRGIGWIERGKSEDATIRKILHACIGNCHPIS
jgi:hypothetical protein